MIKSNDMQLVAKESPSVELIKALENTLDRLHATNMKVENRLGALIYRDPTGVDIDPKPVEFETCNYFQTVFTLMHGIETHITNLNRKIDDILF